MKVIIAGGSGFLGRRLSTSFVNDGHAVTIVSRNPGNLKTQKSQISFVSWNDLQDSVGRQNIAEADVIINLAGENIGGKRWTEKQKTKLLSSRIEPTKQLVDLINASQIKPKKFINASAVGFYGDCADQLIDENKSVGNDFLAEICVKWEEQAKLIEQSQTDFIILRIGVVLDAKEGALPRMVLPFKIFAGGKLASGRQWVPWIHIDDLVSIFRYLITTPGTSGVYNATAPNPVTNSQLTASIAKILRRPAWFPVPTFALKIALGEQAMLVLNGQRVIPDKLIKAGHPFQFSEIDTALMDILKK